MPHEVRTPPYPLQGGDTFVWGSPYPATASSSADVASGQLQVDVSTDASNGSGGYAWASLGVLEIGDPVVNAQVSVSADVSYTYHYLLDVHRAVAYAFGDLSMIVESIPPGQKVVLRDQILFDANAYWVSKDVTNSGSKTLSLLDVPVDPHHTYKASVFASVVALGVGITHWTKWGFHTLKGSRAEAHIQGTVSEFRIDF